MTEFEDLKNKVYSIGDMILSNLKKDESDGSEEILFQKTLYETKNWFRAMSWENKRCFAMTLLNDIQSLWTLSILLKSSWNSRLKDAVFSISNTPPLSSYDRVPMDNNRTAQPPLVLSQMMIQARDWFRSLENERQALVFGDLLVMSGGPILWEIIEKARKIHRDTKTLQMEEMVNRAVQSRSSVASRVHLTSRVKVASSKPEVKEDRQAGSDMSSGREDEFNATAEASKLKLKQCLWKWDEAIKNIRTACRLDEIEIANVDGTTRKMWRIHRPNTDTSETVDFIQLLPAAVGKRILYFLPTQSLSEYSKVNKYWAYLIEDIRYETNTRDKLIKDLQRMKHLVLEHDDEVGRYASTTSNNLPQYSSTRSESTLETKHVRIQNSDADMHVHMRPRRIDLQARDYQQRTQKIKEKPIRNLYEVTERLNRRGAVDENLFNWCKIMIQQIRETDRKEVHRQSTEGIMPMDTMLFPCPMLKTTVDWPLKHAMIKDPANSCGIQILKKTVVDVSSPAPCKAGEEHFSLWSRDFSSLYKVLKVPSYMTTKEHLHF